MKLTETQLKKIINEEFGRYLESLSPEELQHLIDEGWMSDMGSKAKKGIAALGVAGALAGGGLGPSDAEASPVGGGQGIEQTVSANDSAQLAYINQQINNAMTQVGGNMQSARIVKSRLAAAARARKNSLKDVNAEMANLPGNAKTIWEKAKEIGGEAYSKQEAAGKNMAQAEAAWGRLGGK